jgi:hypothetical protein
MEVAQRLGSQIKMPVTALFVLRPLSLACHTKKSMMRLLSGKVGMRMLAEMWLDTSPTRNLS